MRVQQNNSLNKKNPKSHPGYHPSLNRQSSIPAQYFMQYKKLQKKSIKSYYSLFKSYIQSAKILDYQLKISNLVCRFLQQHNYNFMKTSKQLQQYFQWQLKLRKSYTMNYFSKFIQMDIFSCIGNDKQGRPILLFKTYNFIADEVPVVSDYIDYIFYFILIETMSKYPGYFDDFIVIADASNNTSRNFKLQVNKRMIPEGLKFMPRTFFKMIIINSSTFPYYVYQMAKPILPTYSNDVIRMFKEGSSQDALKQCCLYMDKSIVPAVIGGGNYACKDKGNTINNVNNNNSNNSINNNNNSNNKSEEGKSTRDQ